MCWGLYIVRNRVTSERVNEAFKSLDEGETDEDKNLVCHIRARETLNGWKETEKAYG